jgi:protein-S-isoprenylcysteine O-methyltransferase Ste14
VSGLDAFQLIALLILGALVAGKAAHVWIAGGVNPVTVFEEKDWRARVLDALFVIGTGTFAFRVLCHVAGSSFLLFYPLEVVLVDYAPVRAAGAALVAAALVILTVSYRTMGRSWRIGVDERAPGPLVTSGVYRWSRHPIYLGADLYVIGTFLMNGTVLFLLFATFGPAVLHLLVVAEERSLERLYGRAYADYRARTGRYLGFARPFERSP